MTTPALAEHPLALEVDAIDVSLGHPHPTQILHGVSLAIRPGQIVGLIGETGSGKTTLARTVLGLTKPQAGSVRIAGEETTRLTRGQSRAFRRAGSVQYVFQDPLRSLDPDFTVARSVSEAMTQRDKPDAIERARRVADALALVGLNPDLADRRPAELSGGQRQRVAIARAMAVHPRLLICDEPVSALDAASKIYVLELLRDLAVDQGVGILLITHDLGSLAGIADEIAVLYRGSVVEAGPTAEVLLGPSHPYTRLLLASLPTLHGPTLASAERHRLRAEVTEWAATVPQ
jgi:ABC-type dipeptide/oligopeptide/nickel transport system ATPase subunit